MFSLLLTHILLLYEILYMTTFEKAGPFTCCILDRSSLCDCIWYTWWWSRVRPKRV